MPRLAADQSGYGLIELVIVITLVGAMTAAFLGILDTSGASTPRDQERALAIREAQVGLDRMTRELRQAYQVLATSPGAMEVLVNGRIGGSANADRHVLYRCDVVHPTRPTLRRCVRVEAAIGAALPALSTGTVVIDRVLSPAVFAFSPDALHPDYVRTTLRVPAGGDRADGSTRPITLDDGFYLRNASLTR